MHKLFVICVDYLLLYTMYIYRDVAQDKLAKRVLPNSVVILVCGNCLSLLSCAKEFNVI